MTKKLTWTIPQRGNSNFRKYIAEGTAGVIEGWADLEQRQVLLKAVRSLPSGLKKTAVHEAYPRNLKLTSEYNEAKGTGEALPEAGSKGKKAGSPEWALEGREPAMVKVDTTQTHPRPAPTQPNPT